MPKRVLFEVPYKRVVRRRLKLGSYEFTFKLVDAPAKPVEIYKNGEPFTAGYVDPYGFFSFDDEVKGIKPIRYEIRVGGEYYGRVEVYPLVIDANEILEDTLMLTKSVMYGLMRGGGVWLRR